MEESLQFRLSVFQQFLYIKGCLTSVSEECEVWRYFINNVYDRLHQQQRDELWALVYRDIYLPMKDNRSMYHFWDDMLRFLAMYNLRNQVRIVVRHPEYGKIATRAYVFHGKLWVVGSDKKIIPDQWVQSQYRHKREVYHENLSLGLVSKEDYEDLSIY